MDRREFIKCCFVGGVTAATGLTAYSWLAPEEDLSRETYHIQDIKDIQGLSEDKRKILYLSCMAPSGHNAQPWTVAIREPKRWIIGSDRTRWLPAVDPDNREMMLSIGAFLENLSVAAAIQGYEAEYAVVGKDNFSAEIAEVKLHKRKEAAGISDRAIRERRTVRNHLLTHALREEDINYLVGNHKNKVFYYPLHSKEGAYLSHASLLANKIQACREDAQQELAEWIRWSDREAKKYQNGLTPDSMEMQGIVRWYAKHFLSKEDVLSKSFRDKTIQLVEEQVKNCAGWLVVTSDSSAVADLISAGRVLQSMWLRAHDRLIAFHPMTQVLEENPWRTELPAMLGHMANVQFVVRIGYIKEQLKPVSLRIPISRIIVK